MKKKAYRKMLARAGYERKEQTMRQWAIENGLLKVVHERFERTFVQKIKHFVLRPIGKWLYLSK